MRAECNNSSTLLLGIDLLPKHQRGASSISVASGSSINSLNAFLGRYGLAKPLDQIEESIKQHGGKMIYDYNIIRR